MNSRDVKLFAWGEMPTKLLNSTKDDSFGIMHIYCFTIICKFVQQIFIEHLLSIKHLQSAGNTMAQKIMSLSYILVR